VPGIIPKDNVRQKRLDGAAEAHEALPDTKICDDAQNAGAAADPS
jgi:hypothetical protein